MKRIVELGKSEQPVLIDLFCGAAGASMGYHRAGFRVVGVDKFPQPHYPFEFHQADALDVLQDHAFLSRFDAIAASPTCQRRSRATAWRGRREDHPDTLTPTLQMLAAQSIPYVVENVPEAVTDGTLRQDFLLCGTQFGLKVKRHRAFEIGNWTADQRTVEGLPKCSCYRNKDLIPFAHKQERAFADAMGCTWMTAHEGRQAIPPAFTEFIGTQLQGWLSANRSAQEAA